MTPTDDELEMLRRIKRNEAVRRDPVLNAVEQKGWARQLLSGWAVTAHGDRVLTAAAVRPGV